MKRILCILLSAIMLIGLFPFCVAAEEPDIKMAIADVFSSEYGYDTCKVYLVKDKWLMDISDISRYTRTSISNSEKKTLLTHGTRNITIDISNSKVSEDGINFDIETYQMGNKTLIHAFPILTYLGAECDIEDNRLVINMPQSTIWEGLIRSSNENYFTLETFGGELEQNTRLILNGILKILESGLSSALFDNAMKDALIEAMQIDPLKYNGSWEIKEKTDERYSSMISAMIAANDFSPDFNEVFDRTESLIKNIAIEYLIGANEDDALYVLDLKGTKGLFDVVSTASSFLSNLSTNSKCTNDSLAMVKAFSKHTTKYSKYYLAANSVQSKVESELSSTLDAARDIAKDKIADKFVDKAYEQLNLGKSGYLSVTALIEESVNISVMLHKLIYGENNAFAYSSAETNAINLLMFKNELIKDMDNLGKKILSDNYTNEQDIEDYRLLNVLYYRILIAANEQLEDMIVAQGRENEADMEVVINNLHKNNDIFAKNLYRLIISKGTKFADTNKLSKSNIWDNFEELKKKAKEYNKLITVLEDHIEADSIKFFDSTVGYDFSVIEKNGRFGLIDYNGQIILPIEYDSIDLHETAPNGLETKLLAYDTNSNAFWIEKDGTLSAGFLGGWGFENGAEVYWMDGPLMFDNFKGKVDYSYDAYKSYRHGSHTLGTITNKTADVIPIQKISGYSSSSGDMLAYSVTKASEKYALFNLKTEQLITDFIFDDCGYNGFIEGVLPVQKDGKWGYINEDGKMLTDFIYDTSYETQWGNKHMYSALNNYSIVRQGDLWGLIDNQGNEILEVKYEGVSQVNKDGYIWLKSNNKWSLCQIGQ